MIINPAIIALIVGSLLVAGFSVYACAWGAHILRWWDLSSGSAAQLQRERRTYLISTILSILLGYELFSLFLFVHTADHLYPMFIGAMCAAGSLHVNAFGYPALVVKMLSVLACGIWLMVNQADSRAEDYPLIGFKYRALFGVTALLVVDALLEIAYFKGLTAHVITSCCGTLFSSEARSIAGDIAALPVTPTRIVFFLCAALHLRFCIHFLFTGRGATALGWISALFFAVAVVAVISFISVYYYALPTHHCPFDLLQGHYHYVGYPLYAAMFGVGVSGMGVGVLARFARISSLETILPALMRRYAWFSLVAGLIFTAMAAYPMIFSDFTLDS